MSPADVTLRSPQAAAAGLPSPARAWLRLLGSELLLVFRRRRNLALLAVVAVIPIIIAPKKKFPKFATRMMRIL